MPWIDALLDEAAGWDGVARSGRELRFDGRLLARLDEDGLLEPVVPPPVRAMLVEIGRLDADARFRVAGPADLDEARELLRLAYERARVARAVREARR